MMFRMPLPQFAQAFSLLWVGLLQLVRTSADGSPQPPGIAAAPGRTAETVVRELTARSASWVAPPATLETLENVHHRGRRTIRAARGADRRHDRPLLRLALGRARELGPRTDRCVARF